ncbi:MAG: hypothetical protein ABIW84_11220 [Ilumatobacteraceae bacterium]
MLGRGRSQRGISGSLGGLHVLAALGDVERHCASTRRLTATAIGRPDGLRVAVRYRDEVMGMSMECGGRQDRRVIDAID